MKRLLLLSALFLTCFWSSLVSADCNFTGADSKTDFKNCNPSIGIKTDANIELSVIKDDSDFSDITAAIVRRVQILTAIVAIGVIVWIGLILVLPVSAEAKENAKTKVFSVVLGFLVMIGATLIIQVIINFVYDIFQ